MTLQEFFARDDSWCQGKYKDSGGRRCLLGGLKFCYPGDKEFHEKFLAVVQHVPDLCASRWNDAPGRTIEDVRELVRKAGV